MPQLKKPSYFNALTNPSGSKAPVLTFGVVYDVNPSTYTVDVYTEGGTQYQGIPVLNQGGSEFNKGATVLEDLKYCTVLMIQMGSSYYVLGTVPRKNMNRSGVQGKDTIDLATTIPVEISDYTGSEYASGRLNDYQDGRPIDIIPGDKVLSLSNGTILGLFKEGIAKLKASQLCQLILFKYKDLARLVTRTFELFSDFGEITIGHDKDDKVGLHLAGGANFNETHPSQAKWSVQAWVGSSTTDPAYELKSQEEDFIQHSNTEDVRLYIRVNDTGNSNSATFTMDQLGHIVLSMSGDSREAITKNKRTQVGMDEYKDITGNKTVDVGEDSEEFIQGDKTVTVGGDKSIGVIGQLSMNGNEGVSIGSGRNITIQTDGEVNIIASKITLGSS